MASLVAAAASSHAFALEPFVQWTAKRARIRSAFERTYGFVPEEPTLETPEAAAQGCARIASALASVGRNLREARTETLVLVSDDQDELFSAHTFPQIAVYTGGDFTARRIDRAGPPLAVRADSPLAATILETGVAHEFDLCPIGSFPDAFLSAHAFGPVIEVIDPDATMAVVPVFVNAIHVPAPSPARCVALGRVLAAAVALHPGAGRVAVYGSGGLSHFPASYPPGHHPTIEPFPLGHIDEEFDAAVLDGLRVGDLAALATLTPAELLAHGAVELRAWLVAAGAAGGHEPALLVYEPLRRAITGLGVAYWDLT